MAEAIHNSIGAQKAIDYYNQHMYDDPSLYDSQGVRDIVEGVTTVGEYLPVIGTVFDGIEFMQNPTLLNGAAFGTGALFDMFTLGAGKLVAKGLSSASKWAASKLPKTAKTVRRVASNVGRRVPSPPTVNSKFLNKYGNKIALNILDLEQNVVFNSMQRQAKRDKEKKQRQKNKSKVTRPQITVPQDNTRVTRK